MTEPCWRILRGGFWDTHPRGCHSAYRYLIQPDFASYGVGFRVACSAPVAHTIPLEETHG